MDPMEVRGAEETEVAQGRRLPMVEVLTMDMQFNDDLWQCSEKFIGQCAKCGREGLKRNMYTLSIRTPRNYAAPRTLCHICPSCLPALLDELEVSMPK